MINIKVSVIVPIYKIDEIYLRKCIESIIHQTLKEIEIILIDDGSPDNCGKICDEYAKKDSRILVVHKNNEGVSMARNLGIEISRGKYIGFIDGDDWIEVDFYDKMINFAEKNNLNVVISGFVKEKNNIVNQVLKKEENQIFTSFEAKEKLLERKIFEWSVCDKIYKANVIKNKNFFDKNIKMGEDLKFIWETLNNSKIGYISLNYYHYCFRKNSATRVNDPEKKWDSIIVMEDILDELKNINRALFNRMKYLYIKELSSSSFDMLMYDEKIYKNKIISFQTKIRKNILSLLYGDINLKVILGIFYFIFPFAFCASTKSFLGEIFTRYRR